MLDHTQNEHTHLSSFILEMHLNNNVIRALPLHRAQHCCWYFCSLLSLHKLCMCVTLFAAHHNICSVIIIYTRRCAPRGKIYLPWAQRWKLAAGKWFTQFLNTGTTRIYAALITGGYHHIYAQYTCALRKLVKETITHTPCLLYIIGWALLGQLLQKRKWAAASTNTPSHMQHRAAVMWLRCARRWLICLCVFRANCCTTCGANTCIKVANAAAAIQPSLI